MRAETPTKLPLSRWAAIMGVNPLHAAGVYVRSPTVCATPFLQYAHQSADRIGREDLAQAISQAEGDIERELGYRIYPSWEIDEWRPSLRPFRPELFNLSVTDVRGFHSVVDANWGYFISGGIRSKEVVQAGAAVAYSDADGDGYDETAIVTVAGITFVDHCEVSVYFPVGGPVVTAGLDEWEIRPVQASISAGTLTIRLRREQLVLPQLQVDLVPPPDDSHLRGVDGAVATNFLTAVDVYRVYNDPQRQVQFLWEPRGCSNCAGSGCATCSYDIQEGCLVLRGDPRHSIVSYHPAVWNATTFEFDEESWSVGRQPDLIRLWYYAGWRDKAVTCATRQMDRMYERMVAYYAASLLDRPVCGCDNVTAYVDRWQRNLAVPGEEGMRISAEDLANPFGTRAGALFAWKRLDNFIASAAIG